MVVTRTLRDDQKAYVLNEKQPYITIFSVNSTSGALKQLYSVKTLPIEHYTGSGEYGAEIALHSNEKWLYVSHRGTGSIIAYQVLENGFLVQSQVCLLNNCYLFKNSYRKYIQTAIKQSSIQ